MSGRNIVDDLRESVAAAKQGRTDEPAPRKTPALPADSDPWGADPRPQAPRRECVIRYRNGRAVCSCGREQSRDRSHPAAWQSPMSWAEDHVWLDGCGPTIESFGFPRTVES